MKTREVLGICTVIFGQSSLILRHGLEKALAADLTALIAAIYWEVGWRDHWLLVPREKLKTAQYRTFHDAS